MDFKSMVAMLMPVLKMVGDKVAEMIADKDADEVGVDDELAAAIKHVITRLEKYV